jgi:glycosyltransferase involved in cell wall biosynthesis
LESFRRARETIADAHLVVIGGREGDIDRYRRGATEAGIGGNVHFLGPRPLSRLGGYLQQADILVSPRMTGQNTPMKIYSYLDSGRPVLATRLPTHTQVLDDEIALLADPEPEAFADGLVRLLRDAELRTMLGKIARLRVRELYSREAFRRKMNSFYDLVERELDKVARKRSDR